MTEDSTSIGAEVDTDVSKDKSAVGTPASSATIFVGNLPFDTRDDQLEKVFSEIGPIKRAFIVKDKDNRSKSRGCGYVQFVLQEDADKCVKTKKTIGNRQLRMNYAAKKPKHAKRKLLALQKANESVDQPSVKTIEKENVSKPVSKIVDSEEKKESKGNDNSKTELQRTIVLTGLTAKVKRKAFRVLCEQFGEIETIVYPVPERDEVTAFVRFKEYKGAIRATQKIPGKKVKKSGVLSACLLIKEGKIPTKKKLAQARLIVRNLSFKCEEDDLRQQFSKFGKVVSVNIPTKKVKNKDVKIGCGFVQFAETANAKVALAEMNLKEIMERQVVVDWAIAKNAYNADKKTKDDSGQKNENEKPVTEQKKGEGDSLVGGKSEKHAAKEEKPDKKKTNKRAANDMKGGENEEDMNGEEDDMSDSSEDEREEMSSEGDGQVEGDVEDEDEEEGDEDYTEDENDDDDGEVEDEDDDEDEEDEDEDDEDGDQDDEPLTEKPKKQLKDAKEGRTIFIRNLSYNVDDGMLEEEFDKYGEIEYCKMVIDHETGRPKGTAFVKFKEKKSCDACVGEFVKKEQSGVNVTIDGRAIVVSLAVTKGKLGEIQQEKDESKKENDKRNLYLASEGIVTRNSPAAEGLSDADLKKREKALMEKKARLKNPNYFVSRTRLCIRNLPLASDADTLNMALKKFVPPEVNIGKVKIMRSNDRRDLSGKPRSLGFGFIEMDTHEHALTLLRAVNNNPKVFGDKRRPIVEFSVENAKALKILELKKKRLDAKQQQLAEHGGDEKLETDMAVEKKKALQAKMYEKKKKRIARYKKKREAKKLLKGNNGQNVENEIKTITSNKVKDESSKSLSNVDDKLSTLKETAGVKRTSSAVDKIDQPSRKSKKKASKEEAKFTSMVEQYKQKILGTGEKTGRKQRNDSRWFE